ncbi:flavin containing polyamine oxidase, putative [Trichophyton benhamiae CBS 112371]|uniref:Flavin containing polyamine oxidase, putative n=1 Tax=Arthroderma benhamiae (strain ATCC MYA-4681 / CBS 112371) TaxID=663331 RepID=D4AZT5_ARTBC|nr:flavin containing polyamine oxidase, putative [Trichophyton benhamiae CBS 112371]EFE31310.1 flavin containing polyamine oxidase, putative [Trichophyton benhamiae CBS 112371]
MGRQNLLAERRKSQSYFIIVEYQDRIGGRLHNVKFGKKKDGSPYTVEAGANWAKKYKLQALATDYDNKTTYDKTGKNDFSKIIANAQAAMEKVVTHAGSLLKNNIQDKTVRAALRFMGWNPAANNAHAQFADWFGSDFESSFTPEENSAVFSSVADNATFKHFSDDNLFVYDQRGYSKLPLLFFRVSLLTIATFSLGVLQRDVVQFYPPFPSWKKSAISSFEIGTYTKIFLQFDKAFWPNSQYLMYADPHERGYYPLFQPLDLPGALQGSGILVGTVVGKQARRVEAQTNQETQEEIMKVLRTMFGESIPDPTDIWYPRWNQEPWAYGSYSNWPPSTSLQAHQNLRANVGRLSFAGEATSQEFYGYLHGALFEGRAVGQMLATCINDPVQCTDKNGQPRYPVLTGVTPYDLYNEKNGWFVSTMA